MLTVISILFKIVAEKHGSDFPDLLQTAYHFCSQYTEYRCIYLILMKLLNEIKCEVFYKVDNFHKTKN